MELLTVIKCPAARGAAVRDPTHQLSVHGLHVCRVLLISAPFMHFVHHHSTEGFALQCCSFGCVSVYHFIWSFSVKGTYVSFPPMFNHSFVEYDFLYSHTLLGCCLILIEFSITVIKLGHLDFCVQL